MFTELNASLESAQGRLDRMGRQISDATAALDATLAALGSELAELIKAADRRMGGVIGRALA